MLKRKVKRGDLHKQKTNGQVDFGECISGGSKSEAYNVRELFEAPLRRHQNGGHGWI